MASTPEREGVADPTAGGARRIKRNATLAAAEQLERLRCLDMMGEYRQCICKSHVYLCICMSVSRVLARETAHSVFHSCTDVARTSTLSLFPSLSAAAFHQFHQYYIHGEFTHCKMEKSRMYNCIKWKTSQNEEAKVELQQQTALVYSHLQSYWRLCIHA